MLNKKLDMLLTKIKQQLTDNTRWLILFWSLFSHTKIQAQTYSIDSASIDFGKNSINSWQADIDPEAETVAKAWSVYTNENLNIKIKKISKKRQPLMFVAKEVVIPKFSERKINIYSQFVENNIGCSMVVFATDVNDNSISANSSNELEAIRTFMNTFLRTYLNEHYLEEIKATTAKIRALNKQRDAEFKKMRINDRQIIKLKTKIQELENRIKYTDEVKIEWYDEKSKFNKELVDLEALNTSGVINVKTLTEKIIARKRKLEKLNAKHYNLIKN